MEAAWFWQSFGLCTQEVFSCLWRGIWLGTWWVNWLSVRNVSLKLCMEEDDLLCRSACTFKNALSKITCSLHIIGSGRVVDHLPLSVPSIATFSGACCVSASQALCSTLHGSLELAVSLLPLLSSHPKCESCSRLWGLCSGFGLGGACAFVLL